MPTSYTSLLGLALPVTGELAGQWGTTVNDYITQYVDSSVAGTQTISGSQTAVTLSVTNGSSLVTAGSGATGSAQFQIINCTGNPAGLLTITAPASSRQYIIINATSTSQSVKIVGSGPTTGVTILSGEKAHVAWNGSDFVKIATQSGNGSFVDLTVSGSMTLSGGTANGVLYLNGSKVATSGSVLVFDGTNLGLGATPSAWYVGAGTSKAIQFNASSALYDFSASGNRQTHLINNAYLNTSANWIYLNTDAASRYVQNAGIHSWHTAASGTAGTNITFTQAMTLDASGNLSVGTTTAQTAGSNYTALTANGSSGSNLALNGGGTNIGLIYAATGNSNLYVTNQTASGNLIFGSGSGTERARITSGGDLLVGTVASSSARLYVRGSGTTSATASFEASNSSGATRFYVQDDGTTRFFGSSGSETARITSEGYLLVGDTSTAAGERLRVVGSVGNHVCRFVNTKGTTLIYGPQIAYSAVSPNDTGNEFITCVDSTATRMTVRSNGGIANYSANDVNLSDRREKTNFAPAKSYLDTICAIPVQTFNYIDQSEDDPGLTLGVVAQDVQAVAPELVMESNWGTQDDPKMRLSIYQTDLQYALMKCIQEQQTIIQSLTARIAALESKGV